ncbi:MAG: tetratricopeptide repeat protein [Alphaproteobacteria bacterium]|nr:tetratricopeptide repeat protein [Alphaproteobacteria bacterium]
MKHTARYFSLPRPILSRAIKLLGSALIVLAPMSLALWPASDALSVAGKSTGWCSDNSGRNFRCGSGGGGGGGGGAGCATAYQNSDAAISKSNSSGLVTAGNHAWDRGDFANAADLYHSALVENPNNRTARSNHSNAINKLGVDRYDIGDYDSAFLFFDRALRDAPANRRETKKKNLALAQSRMSGSLNCSTCGKAVISDVGYGLDNSASFLSYANQAAANFDNCTRRISDSCDNSNGKWLRGMIKNCSITIQSIQGIKSCIAEAWRKVN